MYDTATDTMVSMNERAVGAARPSWRLQCPKFLRQTFVAGAAESIRHAFWAQVYSQQQRDSGRFPGKGTGYPAPSPQTRTCAINASGSSVASSLRQWLTKQATPRLAHNFADPGPAKYLDTMFCMKFALLLIPLMRR